MSAALTIPDPDQEPTISVPQAGRLMGIKSRASAYEAAKRGEIPFIKVGRQKRVPTAQLLRLLGRER